MYGQYADALMFAGKFDLNTRAMLDALMEACSIEDNSCIPFRGGLIPILQIHYSLLLEQMGVEPEKQKQFVHFTALPYLRFQRHLTDSLLFSYIELSLRHFRKAPMYRDILRGFVKRRNGPAHPVAIALGEAWFDESTENNRRTEKKFGDILCAKCQNLWLEVKMFRCKQCQICYYWYGFIPNHFSNGSHIELTSVDHVNSSKECQRAHWSVHKYVTDQVFILQLLTVSALVE